MLRYVEGTETPKFDEVLEDETIANMVDDDLSCFFLFTT